MRSIPQELDLRVDRDSEVPLGIQLAWKLRSLMGTGELAAGDRLPSVRDLALAAGVNVNTVRTVYGRLESEGLIRSEQGRGTFVAAPGRSEDRAARHELRRQIAALEAELSSRAQAPAPAAGEPARPAGGRLPTTDELRAIRDRLMLRLRELDEERADVLRRLAELEEPEEMPEPVAPETDRRSSASLRGARVRWVGA